MKTRIVALAGLVGILTAGSLPAQDSVPRTTGEHRLGQIGEKIDERLDQRGEYIDQRLDRRGETINERLMREPSVPCARLGDYWP